MSCDNTLRYFNKVSEISWCKTSLVVNGSRKSLAQFKFRAKGRDRIDHKVYKDFNLNNFIPIPTNLSDKDEAEWQLRNWGCVGGLLNASSKTFLDQGWIAYGIVSAQTPPIKAFLLISQLYPDLEFIVAYDIEHTGESVRLVIKNGLQKEYDCERVS